MKKKVLIIVICVLILGGIGFKLYSDNKNKELMINLEDQITQNLEELNTLKNDKYFSKEDINKVEDFETSFDNALNEKDLDALKTVSEDTSELLETSREQIKNYEKQYSELRNQVFKSEELLKSVYSKDADVKTLNQVLTTSNQALEADDYTKYSDLIDKTI